MFSLFSNLYTNTTIHLGIQKGMLPIDTLFAIKMLLLQSDLKVFWWERYGGLEGMTHSCGCEVQVIPLLR